MMSSNKINKAKLINYWIESSNEDYETMEIMFASKRYNWSLFVGHLMLEKLLKAYFVKINGEFPPYTHNLLRLAEKCQIELNGDNSMFFITVTAFNINARYDDHKKSFFKKCTPEYTRDWINKVKLKRLWLMELIER